MANGIKTGDHRGFNKGRSSKFCEGSRFLQNTWRRLEDISAETLLKYKKDEDNSPKTLNDKNQQASSQKFRQLI